LSSFLKSKIKLRTRTTVSDSESEIDFHFIISFMEYIFFTSNNGKRKKN
jgi:hypothetical protein